MIVNFIKTKEGKNLSKSAYKILEVLEKKKVISSSEIVSELHISTRAIHYSLRRLVERKIVDKRPFFEDMRQTRYSISESILVSYQQNN
jgi:DNA-binding MarR family transcriptional regulator